MKNIKNIVKNTTAKKAIVAFMAMAMSTVCLTGCNQKFIDFNYEFDRAVIIIGGEVKEVAVDSWSDYENSDQLQITDTDGNTYLVHSSNVTLINTAKESE